MSIPLPRQGLLAKDREGGAVPSEGGLFDAAGAAVGVAGREESLVHDDQRGIRPGVREAEFDLATYAAYVAARADYVAAVRAARIAAKNEAK